MFNPIAHYGYLLLIVYLFMAARLGLCVVVGHGFVSTSPAFLGALPAIQRLRMASLPKMGAVGIDTIGQQFAKTAVTAPPLVLQAVLFGAHNIPSPGVLMKSIGSMFLRPDAFPTVNHIRGMQ